MFNPRTQRWPEHFRCDSVEIVGVSATGRATVASLDMNRAIRLAIREEEAFFQSISPTLPYFLMKMCLPHFEAHIFNMIESW